MRHVSHVVRTLNAVVISLGVILSPVANALVVTVGAGRNTRGYNDDSQQLERAGVLERGAQIEIPDGYVERDASGKVNFDKTLMNWLAAGKKDTDGTANHTAAGFFTFNDTKHDYFFPVKIVKSSRNDKSGQALQGQTRFIALRSLLRVENGLTVSEDTTPLAANDSTNSSAAAPVKPAAPATPAAPAAKPVAAPAKPAAAPPPTTDITVTMPATPPAAQPAPKTDDESTTEFQPTCPPGGCHPVLDANSAVNQLTSALAPELAKIAPRVEHYSAANTDSGVNRNMKSTCGFTLDSFSEKIRSMAEASGISGDLMLATMVRESAGKCTAQSGRNYGLFQIRLNSTKYKPCSTAQLATLKSEGTNGVSFDEMEKNGPQCLQNPMINAKEALKVFHSKTDDLFTKYGFDRSQAFDANGHWNVDFTRIAATAYNSGPAYANTARADLEAFNRKNGTHYNPNKWEDLKLFYFRLYLNRGQQSSLFGNVANASQDDRRSVKWTLSNVAYAETVAPGTDSGSTYRGSSQVVAGQ